MKALKAHQKDKSYYEFWDQKLRPYFQAAFVVFDSCVLQKHIDKVINDFNDAHAVGSWNNVMNTHL